MHPQRLCPGRALLQDSAHPKHDNLVAHGPRTHQKNHTPSQPPAHHQRAPSKSPHFLTMASGAALDDFAPSHCVMVSELADQQRQLYIKVSRRSRGPVQVGGLVLPNFCALLPARAEAQGNGVAAAHPRPPPRC